MTFFIDSQVEGRTDEHDRIITCFYLHICGYEKTQKKLSLIVIFHCAISCEFLVQQTTWKFYYFRFQNFVKTVILFCTSPESFASTKFFIFFLVRRICAIGKNETLDSKFSIFQVISKSKSLKF